MGPSDHSTGSSSSSSSNPISNPLRPPSSTDTLHPLLAPLGPHSHFETHTSDNSTASGPSSTPEKCFTFCSQRADAPPICRMLCLRRRAKQLDRSEELARLRPRSHRADRAASTDTAETGVNDIASPASSSMASTSSSSSSSSSTKWSFNPFTALHRAMDPYSIIYVRGTPDGVVGRYMEEMEFDDGNKDFGESISRHAKPRGRIEREIEYLEWGDEGSLLHLPLTSLVRPITSIPSTLSTIFTPSYNMLSLYFRSFTDGSQIRGAQSFLTSAYNLDALKFLGKIQAHHSKLVERRIEGEAKLRKEVEKTREEERKREVEREDKVKKEMGKFMPVPGGSDMEVKGEEGRFGKEMDRLKTGQGGSSLRRKIEEAMERDEEFRRRKAAAAQGTSGGGSSPGGGRGGAGDGAEGAKSEE